MTPKPSAPVPPPATQKEDTKVEEPAGPPCKIFFGSQTGTAEAFATKMAKALKSCGMSPSAIDMEDYHADGMEQLAEEPFVVYLVATHGEGDPTDNAIGFYDWIKDKERESDELKNVKFACFGLGNKQYEHYNKMGKEFNHHMARLGAQRIGEYGEGDDDVALEDDYNAWLESTVPIIAAEFGLVASSSNGPHEFEYELVTHPSGHSTTPIKASTESIIDNQPWLPANLTVVRELQDVSASGRSTLHVEVSGPEGTDYSPGGSKYGYSPGDHIGVRCENNPKLVAALGARLGCDLNAAISLKAKPGSVARPYRFPNPCLVREALAKYLDICAPPSQEVLKALAAFAKNDSEKQAMLALCSSEGKAEYSKQISGACLTVLEVLDKFPSLSPPLSAVLELLPRLQTRFYSISSSPLVAKDSIHLTVAVVRYRTESNRTDREGVASTWLERMRVGGAMEIFMRTSDFHMPALNKPIVMVGPGTGLAPFRGFIQHRQAKQADGVGPAVLFFGCRSKKYDYIYQRDLEAAEADGTLTSLQLAFSRDQKTKVYVQHLLEQQGSLVWKLLGEQEGSFYICGDAADMARDVASALLRVFEKEGGLSSQQAESKIKEMKAKDRYKMDVWA